MASETLVMGCPKAVVDNAVEQYADQILGYPHLTGFGSAKVADSAPGDDRYYLILQVGAQGADYSGVPATLEQIWLGEVYQVPVVIQHKCRIVLDESRGLFENPEFVLFSNCVANLIWAQYKRNAQEIAKDPRWRKPCPCCR